MAESGRRARLKIWCPKGREGSIPSTRTMKLDNRRRYLMEPPEQHLFTAIDVHVMFDLKAGVMEYAKDRFRKLPLTSESEIPSTWELW